MYLHQPIRTIANRGTSLLGAAVHALTPPCRSLASGDDSQDDTSRSAAGKPQLNLPASKALTAAEQKVYFDQPTQPEPVTKRWKLAVRTNLMTSSAIRDLLKVTSQPGIISFAGGLPSPNTFPVDRFAAACTAVLTAPDARAALQYTSTEGLPALRQAVADSLPWKVDPACVLITTGSQQALDLVAKVLVDPGSPILVEEPTYLGALQAFQPMEPKVVSVESDDGGMLPADLAAKIRGARLVYVLPNYQNPTGRSMDATRRAEISAVALEAGVPVLEDNPYGELWFDAPPPLPMAALCPETTIYMGVTWNRPAGGMFLWLRLPAGMSATALLPRAVAKNVAFVPGRPFYAESPDERNMRLSFVTASVEQIDAGIAALAAAIREERSAQSAATGTATAH